ncbi:MAG TPA: hypothetical protein GX523_12130 [Desulfitobacterium dehalogenans]|uniref:Type II secretion system protein n=1 Tax=Desulfitobacterium dehalogenans TaxID=36854 RepID=A0A7C6Z5A0_9FIRM|nr:hypothetical protein [Desulfitobacterium dehalogenans]
MKSYDEKGFVLLDVILALFLFTVGFVALYGLSENALAEAGQALRLTEAANHAQSIMETLGAESWLDSIHRGRIIPGGEVEGAEGLFRWKVHADWDIPDELLRVKVEVSWPEQGNVQSYALESLYALQ